MWKRGHLYRTLSSTHCSSSLTFIANLEKGGSKRGGAKAVWMNVHAAFLQQRHISCVEQEGGFSPLYTHFYNSFITTSPHQISKRKKSPPQKKREISWTHVKDANITCWHAFYLPLLHRPMKVSEWNRFTCALQDVRAWPTFTPETFHLVEERTAGNKLVLPFHTCRSDRLFHLADPLPSVSLNASDPFLTPLALLRTETWSNHSFSWMWRKSHLSEIHTRPLTTFKRFHPEWQNTCLFFLHKLIWQNF